MLQIVLLMIITLKVFLSLQSVSIVGTSALSHRKETTTWPSLFSITSVQGRNDLTRVPAPLSASVLRTRSVTETLIGPQPTKPIALDSR